MLIVMTLAQWVIGSDDAHYVICQLIATAVTIPFVWQFYRQDRMSMPPQDPSGKKAVTIMIIWAVLIIGLLSIAANNIISMTPLVDISTGYQEANAGFYGSTLTLELISSAIATPFLEELVFRGIVLGRLRQMLPAWASIVLSALIFAVFHFNIVQFIYALIVGLALAVLVQHTGKLYVAVAGHITANAIAVLRTELGMLGRTVDGSVFAWVISIVILAIAVLLAWGYLRPLKADILGR